MAAGSDSREGFETALDEADAAILIVTPRFLGSPFVKDAQLQQLFEQRTNAGMPVCPLVAEPSLWRRLPWLESMHVAVIADRDLPEPSSYEINQKLATFAEEIDDALSASVTADEIASDDASAPSDSDAGLGALPGGATSPHPLPPPAATRRQL